MEANIKLMGKARSLSSPATDQDAFRRTFGESKAAFVGMQNPALRAIPAVEKVLQALGKMDLPRPTVIVLVREELNNLRQTDEVPPFEEVVAQIRDRVETVSRGRLQTVINGTGILIHTNLGRAPLGTAILDQIGRIAGNYNNLEFDLVRGERGSRAAYLEKNLALLCGGEAATVVNNCAAALLLALRYFTRKKREVIISRGELVQIGGGFRIPDILEASGAVLREIGTTNKTNLADYEQAIGAETALILKVHQSNFFMGGFVESPSTEKIAGLARKKRIPFIEDLGSGAAIPTEKLAGIDHEPTAAEVLRQGVGLVTFSGDKLFGGPQAGIVAGKAKWVAALKREPFFRALRCDKLVLTGLQLTVDAYLNGTASEQIPILSILQASDEQLRARAQAIIDACCDLPAELRVGKGKAQLGGGTLPQSEILSVTVDVLPRARTILELATALRIAALPIIGYISSGRFKLDLRTIFPAQDKDVIEGLRRALSAPPRSTS